MYGQVVRTRMRKVKVLVQAKTDEGFEDGLWVKISRIEHVLVDQVPL